MMILSVDEHVVRQELKTEDEQIIVLHLNFAGCRLKELLRNLIKDIKDPKFHS